MKKAKFLTCIIVLTLVFVSIFSMVGCKPKAGKGVYTYNEYIAQSPTSWNSHIGTSDADTYVQQYTEMGFYDITLNADKTSYAFIDEMATGDPVDVTADYVGQYEIKTGEKGRAFKIKLNQSATWQNGVKITSADYLYSMEQLLNPDMKNSKASNYYQGTSELYNAFNYYMSSTEPTYTKISTLDKYTDAEINALITKGQLFFATDKVGIMDGKGAHTLQSYYNLAVKDPNNIRAWASWYYKNKDTSGTNILDILNSDKYPKNKHGYVQVTAENLAEVKECMTTFTSNNAMFGDWYNMCAIGKNTATTYTKIAKGVEYSDTDINNFIKSGQLYFSLDKVGIMDGVGARTIQGYYDFAKGSANKNAPTWVSWYYKDKDINNTCILDTLSADKYVKDSEGYVKITEENLAEVKECFTILTSNAGAFGEWYNMLALKTEEEIELTPFEQVGIFADGEYAIVLVFARSLSNFDVKYALTSNWLVYKDLYEAGKQQQGTLTLTNYGTSVDNYMGYGPYRLATYQKDKELTFERNDNWYGYKADATNYHQGQFQTDRIVAQIINEGSTALLEFEKGNLDQVRIGGNDLDRYKFSDYMLKRTGGNIWQIAFNGDAEALGKIEADGQGNRRILSVVEFRKALSLCLNRTTIGREIAAGSAPAFSYINDNYYYDMENDPNSIYRTSEEGMKAIVDLYGIEYGEGKTYATLKDAYKAITGYDIDQAKADFTTAYNKAIEAGIYTDGATIKINIYTNDLTATRSAIGQHMQTQVDLATQGTKLEGKVKIEWKKQEQGRQEDLSQGKIEASFYSSVADYSDPFGFLAMFTDKDTQTLVEYGFDPAVEKFTLNYDFDGDGEAEDVEMTYADWQKAIRAGGKYSNDVATRLFVLAKLENKLLSNFQTIPLYVGTDVLLRSKKVNYATDTANIFAVYGGVRLMTYNYDDADWANYCKKNTLNYAE